MTFKDGLIKLITLLLGAGLIAYAVRLCLRDASVMQAWWEGWDMMALIFVWLIWLFLVLIVFWESILPNNRRWVLLLGIGLIWSAHVYLADSPENMVYLQDIMKLVWVFLCIAWPTKSLQSKNYEQKKFDDEVEVIEV